MIQASKYGQTSQSSSAIELTDEEKKIKPIVQNIWKGILNTDVDDSTDFFKAGAGSMDVVRLVEEVKDKVKIELKNQDVFMATTFEDFFARLIEVSRDASGTKTVSYDPVEMAANNLNIKFPKQLFINGEFVNSEDGKTLECINPSDESVICQVQCAGEKDVQKAVEAAYYAFEEGEWSNISARERGNSMFK